MRAFWGHGKWSVDRRRERVKQIGILFVKDPEAAAALAAEVALSGTSVSVLIPLVLHAGVMNLHELLADNFERRSLGTDVD